MHSFGQTFAHSSQPMHLNQSMLCWPRYASGSSTFWYGYRWVTGFRPPGTGRLMPGTGTRVCLIVAMRGRTVPPIVPTLRRRDSASDLGDFIRVLALLHVHQLAFPRADEPALLRADPAAPLRLDLRAQFQEAVDQGFRPDGASRDEDVRRNECVRTLHDAVRVVIRSAANRALAHRDDPLWLRHLLVQATDGRSQLQRNRAVQQEHVALPRGGAIDHAEPFHVVPGIRGRRHLDRATHDAKVQGPCGVSFRPVEELADQAALERVQQGTAGTALHRRVDVLLDPLHEVLRTEADDVRLFRPLDHPLWTSVPHAAGRSWSTRISGSLLTLRPRMFTTVSPPGFRPISATKMYHRVALKIGSVRLTSAFATRVRPRRPTTGHRRTGHRDSGGPAGRGQFSSHASPRTLPVPTRAGASRHAAGRSHARRREHRGTDRARHHRNPPARRASSQNRPGPPGRTTAGNGCSRRRCGRKSLRRSNAAG